MAKSMEMTTKTVHPFLSFLNQPHAGKQVEVSYLDLSAVSGALQQPSFAIPRFLSNLL